YPLIGELKANKSELTVMRFRKAQEQAQRILDELVSWWSSSRELALKQLAINVVRQPLQHRFILPARAITPSPLLRPSDVPGWGRWQPVIASFGDLLTWATANVLTTGTAGNLGRCEHCRKYYFSHRQKKHRFCPDR